MIGPQGIFKAAKEIAVPWQKMRASVNAMVEMRCVLVGVRVNDASGLDVIKRLYEAVVFNSCKIAVVLSSVHIILLLLRIYVPSEYCRPYADNL
jgi:hypothetical protein